MIKQKKKEEGYRDANFGRLRDWEGHPSCTFPVKQAQFHFLKPRLWDGSDVEADYPDGRPIKSLD